MDEVDEVAARAVPDEEHPGHVGGPAEERGRRVVERAAAVLGRQRDRAEPAERGDTRVDGRGRAALRRERELNGSSNSVAVASLNSK